MLLKLVHGRHGGTIARAPAVAQGNGAAPPPARRTEILAHALAARLQADLAEGPSSWVVLAPRFAFRILKPVRGGAPAGSNPVARRTYCEETVRLERRLASDVVLGVEPIHGTLHSPHLGGGGDPIDYAIRMHRFAADATFLDRLERAELGRTDIDDLADLLARFHALAAPAPHPERHGAPSRRLAAAMDGLDAIRPTCTRAQHRALEVWLQDEAQALLPLWFDRIAQGWIREGHGDLRLGHIVRVASGVAAINAVQAADRRLRDVADDIAAPVMDLVAHGQRGLAFRLLDRWLDTTGDHGALPLLRFAAVTQALHRVRWPLLHGTGQRARDKLCIAAAHAWIRPAAPQLSITYGGHAADRQRLSQSLLEQQGAIRVRFAAEQARLSRRATAAHRQAVAEGAVHAQMLARARACMESGYPVVLEAPFLDRADRLAARKLAQDFRAQFLIATAEPHPAASQASDLAGGDLAPGGGVAALGADEAGFVQWSSIRAA